MGHHKQSVIDNNPTQYIIIMEHYQWFNGISGATSQFSRWQDFMDRNNVDLAIAGNNHIYVRTKSIYDGKASNTEGKGTVYIQTPSSDNERGQDMNDSISSNKDLIEYRFTEGGKTVGGVIMTVNKEGISLKLLDRNGTKLDETYIKTKREVASLDSEKISELANDIKYYQNGDQAGFLVLPKEFVGYVNKYCAIRNRTYYFVIWIFFPYKT